MFDGLDYDTRIEARELEEYGVVHLGNGEA
jgi:hypothetical protein